MKYLEISCENRLNSLCITLTRILLYSIKSGLNEVMSIDRIAEIKRKIMTRKRGTIKGDEDYNPEVPQVAVRKLITFKDIFIFYFFNCSF